MTDDQLRQLAADVLNGKTDPDTIPSGWDFLRIQKVAQNLNRQEIVQRMMEVSANRLKAKGYVQLEGMGWKTRAEIADSDLVMKNGRWYVGKPRKAELLEETPTKTSTRSTKKSTS